MQLYYKYNKTTKNLTKFVTQLQVSNAQLLSELLHFQVSYINDPNKNIKNNTKISENLDSNSGVSKSRKMIQRNIWEYILTHDFTGTSCTPEKVAKQTKIAQTVVASWLTLRGSLNQQTSLVRIDT
ncbi:Hypothetical protein CINCED_3A024548 [Cinara cedri]|uniref:Uncharacterized protein n=1 Tax=Cinara cedri TaxID=506608 RepID=A0A5E4MXU8_9HEMI|nr:Hypothetical protein CINCED_3A024548 [Cinara cedri]